MALSKLVHKSMHNHLFYKLSLKHRCSAMHPHTHTHLYFLFLWVIYRRKSSINWCHFEMKSKNLDRSNYESFKYISNYFILFFLKLVTILSFYLLFFYKGGSKSRDKAKKVAIYYVQTELGFLVLPMQAFTIILKHLINNSI